MYGCILVYCSITESNQQSIISKLEDDLTILKGQMEDKELQCKDLTVMLQVMLYSNSNIYIIRLIVLTLSIVKLPFYRKQDFEDLVL